MARGGGLVDLLSKQYLNYGRIFYLRTNFQKGAIFSNKLGLKVILYALYDD